MSTVSSPPYLNCNTGFGNTNVFGLQGYEAFQLSVAFSDCVKYAEQASTYPKDGNVHEVELYKVKEGDEVHASATPESTELSSVEVVEPSDDSQQALLDSGWRRKRGSVSLEGCNSTIKVPAPDAPWYKQWAAYVGVGFMISVGYALRCWWQHTGQSALYKSRCCFDCRYMDPGNWATDIQAGSAFGYTLLIVVLLASFAAMFLQHLALKLGVVTERDLAQACRDSYHPKAAPNILSCLFSLSSNVEFQDDDNTHVMCRLCMPCGS